VSSPPGIFASLFTAPKSRLGWERFRSLAPSREAKQNIFQFVLEENFARYSLKEKEKNILLCAAVRQAEPRGGFCVRHGADCRSKKVRAFSNKGYQNLTFFSTNTILILIVRPFRRALLK